MGTRSLTRVYSEYGANDMIVNMYRQYDGYPDGHGQEVVDFLIDRVVGNGLSIQNMEKKYSNGMGELAAQLVTHFKMDSPSGGIYLYPTNSNDCGQDYVYDIYLENEKLVLVVSEHDGTEIFRGNPDQYSEWLKNFLE